MSGEGLPAVRKQMTDIDGGPIPKGRVSKRLMLAIRHIEEGGLSVPLAAEASGYQEHSLRQALKKPHVRSARADVKRAHRASEAPQAWNRIVALAKDAGSEKVQLEANKTILTALGELGEEAEKLGSVALIQFIRNETTTHLHGQPMRERMPGVVNAEDFEDVDFAPLDPDAGLTPQDDS